MIYTVRIEQQGNGTWLAYGINPYGNRNGVFDTRAEAVAWAIEAMFDGENIGGVIVPLEV